MTIGFTMQVKGDKALMARMQQLKAAKVKSIMRKATRKGARLIWSAAKSGAPVGASRNYRRKIKMRTKVLKDGNVATMVRATAPHSHLVEKGSKERTQKTTGRRTGRAPAQHVMQRAAEKTGQQAADVVMTEAKAEIEKVLNGR